MDAEIKFALDNEADGGHRALDPEYVYEGAESGRVIMIGVAMDHKRLNTAPDTVDNADSSIEVGEQYNRAARVNRNLSNRILEQGHYAKAYAGPYASALLMIPPYLAAGFEELGKHGSVNRTTVLPLACPPLRRICLLDDADVFAPTISARVCTKACPPGAISRPSRPCAASKNGMSISTSVFPIWGSAGLRHLHRPLSVRGPAPRRSWLKKAAQQALTGAGSGRSASFCPISAAWRPAILPEVKPQPK